MTLAYLDRHITSICIGAVAAIALLLAVEVALAGGWILLPIGIAVLVWLVFRPLIVAKIIATLRGHGAASVTMKWPRFNWLAIGLTMIASLALAVMLGWTDSAAQLRNTLFGGAP